MPANQAPALKFEVKVLDLIAVRDPAVDQLYTNNGDATFNPTPQVLDGVAGHLQSRGADVADLDGDGDLDAVVAYGYFGPSTVFLNNGAGILVSTGQGIGSPDVQNVTLGDFDGDGDIDVFLAAAGAATDGRPSQVYINDGTGLFTLGSTVGNATSFDAEAADLDGDGDLDLLVANIPLGLNLTPSQAWLNDGAGNFSLSYTFAGNRSWEVAHGDIDGDGDIDAVFANEAGQRATVYLGDGDGTFTQVVDALSATVATYSGITLADLDGDGDLDVVQVFSDKNAEVLLNDGHGNFTSSGQTDIAAFGWGVAAGDLDNDGDLDIVSTWQLGDEALWINDGTGHFSIQSNFLAATNIYDVQLGAFRSQVSPNAPSLDFTEGEVMAVLPAALVSDSDSVTLSSATLTILGGFAGSGDLLQAVTGGTGITASFANNVLTLSGVASLAAYQQVLRSVTFSSGSDPTDGDTHPTRTISVVLNDGGPDVESMAVEVEIAITDDSRAPEITSGGGGDTASYTLDENATAVATIAASDADNDTVTYSISGGADALRFSIDEQTGALRFVDAPDFEQAADADKDNVYLVEVTASDGSDADTQSLSVTVLNVAGVTIIGNNLANVVSGSVTVSGQPYASGEEDTIYGRRGNDTLNGLGGNDKLFGEDGKDTLNGGDGDDLLDGGTGIDRMSGGKGNDDYLVDNICDVVLEAYDEGTDTVRAAVSYRLDANVENLILTGLCALIGTGNATANSITGSGYANLLIGLGGADALDGGGGLDTASYASSALGVDVSLKTGLGHGGDAEGDTLVRIENLVGSSKGDTLEGDDGANLLNGGAGRDTLSYEHAGAAVTVDLSKTVQATGGSGLDTIFNFENLTGSGFGDTLRGDRWDNVISGLNGSDTLSGGAGSDTLDGGSGADWLTGGAGGDRFVFRTFGDGVDRITDFATRSDKLQIDAGAFGGGLVAGGGVDLAFAGSAGAASHGSGGYFIFDTTGADKGTLYWDANGGSGSDAIAVALLSSGILASGDFLLV